MTKTNSNMTEKISDWHINRANGEKHVAQKEFDQAKKRIDSKYYDFLVLLDQHIKLTNKVLEVTPDGKKIGMWSADNRGTYVTVSKPYVTVDGRVQMARDEHKAADKKLFIHPPEIIHVEDKTIMSVQVDSEIYGSAVGMIEVGIQGNGVDKANPFANAQTSAVGRALGFLGYGLVGTGTVASANEMQDVIDEEEVPQNNSSEEKEEKRQSTPTNAPKRHSVKVQSLPRINQDGSSVVKVMTEDNKLVTVFMPKAHKAYMESLVAGQTLIVNGWLNDNGFLRVNANVEPEIEISASA